LHIKQAKMPATTPVTKAENLSLFGLYWIGRDKGLALLLNSGYKIN